MTTLAPAPTYDFHGHPVRRLIYRGELAFIGREIGSALGYEDDGKRFVSQLTSQWSTEIQEGVHWYRVKGEELRRLKAQTKEGPRPVPSSSGGRQREGGAPAEPRRGQHPEGGAEPVPSSVFDSSRGGAPVRPRRGQRTEGGAGPSLAARSLEAGAPAEPRRGQHPVEGTALVPSSAVDALRGGAPPEPRSVEAAGEGSGTVPSPVPKALDLTFANELVVLTEEGLTLALMRSGQRIAVEFRKWLARDVVPQIARTGRYDPLAGVRAVRPSRDTVALMRIVGAAMAAGRLDVAADLIDAGRRLAAGPGERLLPPPARLRASNRLLVGLIQRGVLKGPRVAQLFQQPAWRPSEKVVLGLLLDLGGGEVGVELSFRDLAERIDVSRSTVVRAILVLEQAGVVTCTRGRGGPAHKPNVYVVDLEALAEWSDKERPAMWSEVGKGPPR